MGIAAQPIKVCYKLFQMLLTVSVNWKYYSDTLSQDPHVHEALGLFYVSITKQYHFMPFVSYLYIETNVYSTPAHTTGINYR